MKYRWILMDGAEYRIAEICVETQTVLLWGDNKTTRIPLYFLLNVGFGDTLGIKYINEPTKKVA